MSAWSLALSLVGVLAYAAISHGPMMQDAGSGWAVAVLLAPPALALATWGLRERRTLLPGLVILALAALGVAIARGGVAAVSLACLLEHAGVHIALGAVFAGSLRDGGSLVGQLAARVHALTQAMEAYTRRVTQAWALYFFAMAALSVALWLRGSWPHWSLFASFGTPLGVATMFVGEYLLRYRLHPEFERASWRDVMHAWRRPPACGAARP
jgi:uncharacterized membrane protein